jgi:hypothetical protein
MGEEIRLFQRRSIIEKAAYGVGRIFARED